MVQQIRNEFGVSTIKIHIETTSESMNYAWGTQKLLRSVLTCHRWSVHLIRGGLEVPSCCVAGGCVSWAAGERGDREQSCTSGSGSSAHPEYGCTELSRATGGESKGIGLLPCRCSALCAAELSSFRQERFWAAVAPFQELIRTWNRAQALNALYLGSEWQFLLLP